MDFLADAETLCLLMFVVTVGFLLTGFPVAFTLAGSALMFAGLGLAFGVFDFSFLTAYPQRIIAVMTSEVLVAVPLFVFMGVMLERSRVAEELLDNMAKLFGAMRGGLGISVAVVGGLLAASTGIVGATVVTMGLLSLPTMLRRGYDPALACGTICASGTLGQIIPPSIVLVLLGDQLSTAYQTAQLELGIFAPDSVTVTDLFAGALFPGLILVGMYILYQLLVAAIRPSASPAIPAEELRGVEGGSILPQILHALVPPVVLIVAVLGSILAGIATPTEAAAVGAVGATLLGGYRLDEKHGMPMIGAGGALVGLLVISYSFDLRVTRSAVPLGDWIAFIVAIALSLALAWGVGISLLRIYLLKLLHQVMRSTMEITSMVFVILLGAAMFSLVFRGLGGDDLVSDFLLNLPGGTVSAIIVVMVIMFILGFFLDFLEIVFIVVPIVAPILLQMELTEGVLLSPVWLGVMMAVNLQTSFLTPPFGFALFYLRGVAPDSITTLQIYRGVVPFILIQLLALIVLWFLPDLSNWLPAYLYG